MQRTNYGKKEKGRSETNNNQEVQTPEVLMIELNIDPTYLQSMYGPLSDFSLFALQLDMVLNPIVSQIKTLKKKESNQSGKSAPALKSKLLISKRESIIDFLERLTLYCKSSSMTYLDFLQARRLMDTFEYSCLNGDAIIDKVRKPFEGAVSRFDKECNLSQQKRLEIMYQVINDLWTLPFEDFCQLLTKGVKRGVHGASNVSALATWEQVEAQFGELLLCLPMIRRIDQLARKQQILYTWDVQDLMVKVLQKTTRRFKVETILETVTEIASICPSMLPLTCGQRILPQAFQSIQGHLAELLVKAVSAKAKEQRRQIQALISVLKQNPELICLGYEMEIDGSEPADLVFQEWDRGELVGKVVIEIESLPPEQVLNAYEYLKTRYSAKTKTIGRFLDCPMMLMMPIGTIIPGEEWEKIEQDEGDLLVWKEEPLEGLNARVIKLSTATIKTIGNKIIALREHIERVLKETTSCSEARLSIYRYYMHNIYEYMLTVLKEDEQGTFAVRLHSAELLRSFDETYDENVPVDTLEVVRREAYRVVLAMGEFLTFVVEE